MKKLLFLVFLMCLTVTAFASPPVTFTTANQLAIADSGNCSMQEATANSSNMPAAPDVNYTYAVTATTNGDYDTGSATLADQVTSIHDGMKMTSPQKNQPLAKADQKIYADTPITAKKTASPPAPDNVVHTYASY